MYGCQTQTIRSRKRNSFSPQKNPFCLKLSREKIKIKIPGAIITGTNKQMHLYFKSIDLEKRTCAEVKVVWPQIRSKKHLSTEICLYCLRVVRACHELRDRAPSSLWYIECMRLHHVSSITLQISLGKTCHYFSRTLQFVCSCRSAMFSIWLKH